MEQGSTLVSCLLPVASTPERLARAILCYQQQIWEHKELVVIDGGKMDLAPLLEDIPTGELQYIRTGADIDRDIISLKNIGLEMARGAHIIHWDPGDWHHPERIHHQMAHFGDGIEVNWMSGTLLHIDHPELVHHPYADSPKAGYAGSLMHINDPEKRYAAALRGQPDRAFLSQWDPSLARQLSMDYAWLLVRGLAGDKRNRRRFLAGLRGSSGDMARLIWLRMRGRDRLSHPRFRLTSEARDSFQKYLHESGKLGIIASIS